ncbi:unnamed protein product [Owenia fusiformis]|nr:unnamed protein product [Owenia fusiformis]
MVITDLPFDRSAQKQPVMQNRYQVIERHEPMDSGDEEAAEESKAYASFLKEQERKCSKNGFLDSSKYTHSYEVKKNKEKMGSPRRTMESDSLSKPFTVVDLKAKIEKDKKDYEKRMRHIEDHMWQHKQEERELKRVEGDVIKNQRTLRQSLREVEQEITKKRMAEERKLNIGLEKYAVLQRVNAHKKEDTMKKRTDNNIQKEVEARSKGRKVHLNTSDLARQYRTKKSEIELKRIEADRISQEFETKMRQKEAEQFKLKQELAELAIGLNMESMKGRTEDHTHKQERGKNAISNIRDDLEHNKSLENKLGKSDGDTKGAEMQRRKLSADLSLNRGNNNLKQREEGRRKLDTKNRIEDNSEVQRQLNEAAAIAETERKEKALQQKLQEHENRKNRRIRAHVAEKKDRDEKNETHWASKFQGRLLDTQRREHEDHLKHFTKTVTKGEEIEHDLYQKVRNSEYSRQKREQEVRRLQLKLEDTKRNNAIKIKNEIADAYKQETTMTQKLVRQKAELAKVHAQREESYITLQKHRDFLREDKHLKEEHEREHARLLRLGNKSDHYLTSSA